MASQSIEQWLNNELLKTRVQLEHLGRGHLRKRNLKYVKA